MKGRRTALSWLVATAPGDAAPRGGSWSREATIVVGAGALLYVVVAALPTALVRKAAAEHGVVETATLILLVAAAALSALAARRRSWESGYLATTIFAAAAMRELDFHKAFTSRSITRGVGIGFVASPDVPGVEKVIVALVGVVLLAAVGLLVRREWSRFRLGVRTRSRPVMLTLVGLTLLVVAVALDDTYGRVKALGLPVAARWQLLEELLELQAAAVFVMSLWPVLRRPESDAA